MPRYEPTNASAFTLTL